jgi:hypothetical protein
MQRRAPPQCPAQHRGDAPRCSVLSRFLDKKAKALLFIAENKEVFYNTHTPRLGIPAYQKRTKITYQGNPEARALPSPDPRHRTNTPRTHKVCFVTVSTGDPIVNLTSKNTQSRLHAHHHNQGWMLHRHNSLREITRQQPEKVRTWNHGKPRPEIFFRNPSGRAGMGMGS